MRCRFLIGLGLGASLALGQTPPEERYPAPTARYAMPPPSAQAFKKAGDVWDPNISSRDLLAIIGANQAVARGELLVLPTNGKRPQAVMEVIDKSLEEAVEKAQRERPLFGNNAIPARGAEVVAGGTYVGKIPAKPTTQFRMVPSPDFRRLAMTEPYERNRWYISVDDRVWEFYEIVDARSLQFSADSKHVLCTGRWEGVWRIVVDNREQLAVLPRRPTELRFLADNKSVAYIAHGDETDCAVIGDIIDPTYPTVARLTVAGKRYAYVASSATWCGVVIDGQVHASNEVVAGPVFTADGKFVRWLTRETVEGKDVVSLIEDDTQLKQWKLAGSFRRAALSPDGTHVAIVDTADEGGHFERLTADGEELPKRYERIERITWSSEGKVAFVGSTRSFVEVRLDTGATIRHAGDRVQVAVIGGVEDTMWFRQIIGPLTFENGGKEMSYCGKDEGDIGTGLYVWDLKRRASSRWGSLDTPGSGSVASWKPDAGDEAGWDARAFYPVGTPVGDKRQSEGNVRSHRPAEPVRLAALGHQ